MSAMPLGIVIVRLPPTARTVLVKLILQNVIFLFNFIGGLYINSLLLSFKCKTII